MSAEVGCESNGEEEWGAGSRSEDEDTAHAIQRRVALAQNIDKTAKTIKKIKGFTLQHGIVKRCCKGSDLCCYMPFDMKCGWNSTLKMIESTKKR